MTVFNLLLFFFFNLVRCQNITWGSSHSFYVNNTVKLNSTRRALADILTDNSMWQFPPGTSIDFYYVDSNTCENWLGILLIMKTLNWYISFHFQLFFCLFLYLKLLNFSFRSPYLYQRWYKLHCQPQGWFCLRQGLHQDTCTWSCDRHEPPSPGDQADQVRQRSREVQYKLIYGYYGLCSPWYYKCHGPQHGALVYVYS